jgi:hypothetical protein
METLYIVHADKSKFKGNVLNTMPFVDRNTKHGEDIFNSTYVHYYDLTFAQYNEKEGGDLVALDWDTFERDYYSPFMKSLQGEFTERNEDIFIDALECLPPKRWTRENGQEFFFVGECYTGNLYSCHVRKGDKYYSALRSINTPKEDIFSLKSVN